MTSSCATADKSTSGDGAAALANNDLKRLEDLMKVGYDTKNLLTAVQARFTNRFDPHYAKPYVPYSPNTDRYLNEELCRLLEDDRRKGIKNHIRSDPKLRPVISD